MKFFLDDLMEGRKKRYLSTFSRIEKLAVTKQREREPWRVFGLAFLE